MSKTMTFIGILAGITLLFYIAGLIEPNPLLILLLSPENLDSSAIGSLLLTGLFATVAAVVVGVLTKNIELSAMTAVVAIIAPILWNTIYVFAKVASFNRVLAIILFGVPLLMYTLNWVDYVRGRD